MDLRALIFMPALAGSVIFGFLFLMYLCHYYLTVLESTGAGAKEVTWISEPITDNFWKLEYVPRRLVRARTVRYACPSQRVS
jgi:hypothetical protein